MQYSAALLPLALFAAAPALAQESVVSSATDAFGERVGIEQLGLYSEGQVRGFDLQASGAYRIEDHYFVRAAPLNDPIVGGVSVRVGVNASRLAYPAPSGVVNYRLRGPAAENGVNITAGVRDFASPVLQADGSWRSADGSRFLAGAAIARPHHTWGGGTNGDAVDLGLVAGWRPAENHLLRAFATWYGRDYDGDYGVLPSAAGPPSPPPKLHNYSPAWARVEAQNINFGLLYRGDFSGWRLDASAFRSIFDPIRSDFTVVQAREDGTATATLFLNPHRTQTSDSLEARLSRVVTTGPVSHLASVSARVRRSEVDLAQSLAVPLGAFDLRERAPAPPEPAWTGARGLDRVDQVTGSLGYGLVWQDRLQLRLGAHRTRYEKDVQAPVGPATRGEESAWFYNASAVLSLTPATSLFASWVTGLEEAGFAPQSALNRNEVLAPVEATQKEFGVRHAFNDDLTLIAAVFEVSKPTHGFRADGTFGLVGEVSHRGVEASLSGRIGERTNIVLGAVAFEPEVSGPLVEVGVVGARPPGIAEFIANASLEYRLTDVWSVDAQLAHTGETFADSRNTLRAPAVTTLGLGARARFELADRPASLRLLASNLTDERGWWTSTSGILWPIAPRTVRALLTVSFG
ncbi:MAG: TonB-dependent receptor [Phenylobacterium sp.]|uniref:TonB-dependent receptor n=1 Tax=Phenylobacterium sp. TaxID=1871053 RepID=UPI003919CE6F